MVFNRLWYFIKKGFAGVFQNRVMSVTSIAVLMSCLVLVGTFWLLSYNVTRNIESMDTLSDIVCFVDEEFDSQQTAAIGEKLRLLDNVREVVFVTRQQAFENYRETLGENAYILDGYDQNTLLRDQYNVTVKDIDYFDETVYAIKQVDGIAKVKDQNEAVTKLRTLQNVASMIFVWLMIILFGVSIFIITNTVKLAVFARRHEINIMKYVGATNWFIRWPFIIEGAIIGFISGGLAYFIQWYLYHFAFSRVMESSALLTVVPFADIAGTLSVIFLASGVLIGLIGSVISIGKYLKV